MECVRTPVIRFKHAAGQQSLTWSSEQTWTQPKAELRYYDETPELVDFYHGDVAALPRGESSSNAVPIEDLSEASRCIATEHSSVGALGMNQTHGEPPEAQQSRLHTALHDISQDQVDLGLSPFANSGNFSGTSPGTNSQTNQSPWTLLSMESNDVHTPQQQPLQGLSETEALLLRNFTENMALWADGPDPQRSFELEASRIALTDPVLRHAICAFSSRHVRRQSGDRDAEALEHQDSCLQLLIPAMSSQQSMSEGVLAAVAILRQNEEMDGPYTSMQESPTKLMIHRM